jgi:hypothetical protein
MSTSQHCLLLFSHYIFISKHHFCFNFLYKRINMSSFVRCLFLDKIPEGRPLRHIMRHPGFEPGAGALLTSGLCHCAVSPFTCAMSYYRGWVFPVYLSIKGQLSARSLCLPSVRGRVRPLLVLYTAFSYISTRGCFHDLTHDLMVTRQQLYCCTRAPVLKQIITITRIGLDNDIMLYTLSHHPFLEDYLVVLIFNCSTGRRQNFHFMPFLNLQALVLLGAQYR